MCPLRLPARSASIHRIDIFQRFAGVLPRPGLRVRRLLLRDGEQQAIPEARKERWEVEDQRGDGGGGEGGCEDVGEEVGRSRSGMEEGGWW